MYFIFCKLWHLKICACCDTDMLFESWISKTILEMVLELIMYLLSILCFSKWDLKFRKLHLIYEHVYHKKQCFWFHKMYSVLMVNWHNLWTCFNCIVMGLITFFNHLWLSALWFTNHFGIQHPLLTVIHPIDTQFRFWLVFFRIIALCLNYHALPFKCIFLCFQENMQFLALMIVGW